jgi:hypothetical protein
MARGGVSLSEASNLCVEALIAASGIIIPVYALDGETIIGEFVLR